jgi:hypothetical protein
MSRIESWWPDVHRIAGIIPFFDGFVRPVRKWRRHWQHGGVARI